MTPDARIYLAVGSGAGCGAALRFLTGLCLSGLGLPGLLATVLVNIVGSFVIAGFATLSGPDGRLLLRPATRQMVMAGFCGGLTTFSSMALEALALIAAGQALGGIAYICGLAAASIGAAWIGWRLAEHINRPRRTT